MRCIKCFSGIFIFFLASSMVHSDGTSEAIESASGGTKEVRLKSPPWNLLSHLRPFAKRQQAKDFKTSYQINPDIVNKWDGAFTKIGILGNIIVEKAPKKHPTFVHTYNGHSTIPILADSGAELLADYQKYKLKKHRKTLWKNLIVGPQKALRKLAKFKVNFSGLGALYGTDDFGHDMGGGNS